MHLCDSCRNYAQCPVTPRPTGVVYSCIHGKPYATPPHPGAHAMKLSNLNPFRALVTRRRNRRPVKDVVPVPMEELATLREIVRLVDEARQRYDKHPRGAGGQRMPDEIDGLLCRLYEMGARPADARPKPRARALTASRVLGDGEAAVDEEELAALRCLDDAVTINGDGMSTEALGVNWEVARSAKRYLANIRAAKGGEAGRELTVEECDENAPLRNMAPLAVRVPRLPVRPEAHP